jgi:hypothetical protein
MKLLRDGVTVLAFVALMLLNFLGGVEYSLIMPTVPPHPHPPHSNPPRLLSTSNPSAAQSSSSASSSPASPSFSSPPLPPSLGTSARGPSTQSSSQAPSSHASATSSTPSPKWPARRSSSSSAAPLRASGALLLLLDLSWGEFGGRGGSHVRDLIFLKRFKRCAFVSLASHPRPLFI